MRREGQVARCGTDRTAMVGVWLDRAADQQAHDASHEAALQWNRLVEWLRAYWVERVADPGFKELRAYGDGLKLAPLHSQSIQAVAEDLDDAVRTYRANKKLGLIGKAPWRVKKYRPVSFTRNFGWRVTPEGKLALSYGRGRERILLPLPVFTDPLAGVVVPRRRGGKSNCAGTGKPALGMCISPTKRTLSTRYRKAVSLTQPRSWLRLTLGLLTR